MKGRGKGKFRVDYTNGQQYYYYKKHAENPVKKALWNDVWNDFIEGGLECSSDKEIKGVMWKIIVDNFEWNMPRRIGTLRVKKKKDRLYLDRQGSLATKYLKVNPWETVKLWRKDPEAREKKIKIYYNNTHTAGYSMSWFWNKKHANFKNKGCYNINIVRTIDRVFAKMLKDSNNKLDYFL